MPIIRDRKSANDYEWITTKLRELFQPKEMEISSLIKLFSCRQTVNQSTREILAEIRRLGSRLSKEDTGFEDPSLKCIIQLLKNQ